MLPAPPPLSRAPLFWVSGLSLLFAIGSWLPVVNFFSTPAAYLSLHLGLETIAMAIAAMVAGLAWNLRDAPRNGNLVVLGAAFLAIGLIDFAHTLSYQGMPEFVTPSGPEKAINFWLAARLTGALAFLAVALAGEGRIGSRRAGLAFGIALLGSAAVWRVGLYHADILPRTFIPGQGLTGLKIGAEYLFVLLHAIAALLLARRGRAARDINLYWLAAASWTLALAELFFAFYASVTDVFNLLGHLYKVAAFVMVYRALFVTGVRAPQEALAAEQARVAELEQRWKFAIEGSGQGVWDWDAATNRVYFSPRWKSMLGHEESEVGDTLAEWETRVHPEDLPAAYADLQRHFEGASPFYENRHRMRAKDGSWRWILDRGMVVARDAAGKPLRVVGTHTDITDLVTAQQALADSEMRYRSILGAMAEGMVVQDADGHVLACNPAAASILGVTESELAGRNIQSAGWLAMDEDGSLLPVERSPAMVALASDSSRRDVVMGIVQPQGKLVWISVNAEPLHYPGEEKPRAVLVTFTDITQRRMHDEAMRQSEARFRAIFDAAPAAVLMLTAGGQIVQVNPAATQMFGRDAGDMAHLNAIDLATAEDRALTQAAIADLGQGRRPSVQTEKRFRRQDGGLFWGSLSMTTLRNEGGDVIALLAIIENIDERQRAHLAVEESNARLEASLAELARHDREISLVNTLYRALQASETAEEVFHSLPPVLGELLPEHPGCLAVLDDADARYHVVARWCGERAVRDRFGPEECALLKEAMPESQCLPLQVQGREIGLLFLSRALPDHQDRLVEVVGEAIKLTLANLGLRKLLEHEASHDPLTGLYNRRSLAQMLPRELARAQRGGDTLAVAMVDADHFKRFNDTQGHEAGDKLLVELARVFRERLRKSDYAARYGGEEFVLVLPDTTLEGAQELLHDVAAAVARIRVGDAGVTVSMGLALAPRHGDSAEALLRAADTAVYRAKANGRNRIEVAEG